MVPPARLERAAHGLGIRCSIRLSYGGTVFTWGDGFTMNCVAVSTLYSMRCIVCLGQIGKISPFSRYDTKFSTELPARRILYRCVSMMHSAQNFVSWRYSAETFSRASSGRRPTSSDSTMWMPFPVAFSFTVSKTFFSDVTL